MSLVKLQIQTSKYYLYQTHDVFRRKTPSNEPLRSTYSNRHDRDRVIRVHCKPCIPHSSGIHSSRICAARTHQKVRIASLSATAICRPVDDNVQSGRHENGLPGFDLHVRLDNRRCHGQQLFDRDAAIGRRWRGLLFSVLPVLCDWTKPRC